MQLRGPVCARALSPRRSAESPSPNQLRSLSVRSYCRATNFIAVDMKRAAAFSWMTRRQWLRWRSLPVDEARAFRKRAYSRHRYRTCPNQRWLQQARTTLTQAMRGRDPSPHRAFELFRCAAPGLRRFIESQFDRSMSWSSYGSRWSVDHIVPCASFDLSSQVERTRCFHWSNLRPLNHAENTRRSSSQWESRRRYWNVRTKRWEGTIE